jgi:hypothetical protein
MAALNAGDEPALLATLHFPHYRLAGGRMRVWDQSGAYLGDFLARAGADWHHSEWDFRTVIAAGPAKVHLDVQGIQPRKSMYFSVLGDNGGAPGGNTRPLSGAHVPISCGHDSRPVKCARNRRRKAN